MLGIDVISSYLLIVALATLLVAVLTWQTHRTGRTVIVWLAAGVLGVILGSIGSYAAMRSIGYHAVPEPPKVEGRAAAGASGGMGGMGMGGMGMGGMSKGGMSKGGMGKGGGMAMGPQPKRELTTLVRKLEILTGDVAVTLNAEQAVAVKELLNDLEKPAKMSDDEAKAKHDKLLTLFNDDQKARFEAIGLPRPTGRPGGSGGMSGMGSGMGMGSGGMGGMMGMGTKQDEDQNPFQQEAEAKSLKTLRDRLGAKSSAAKPADKPASPPAPVAKAPDTPATKDAGKSPAKKP